MAKFGGPLLAALAMAAVAACTTTGQGGGAAGSAASAGMTSAQGAAYCSKLARTYDEYVGTFLGYRGGDSPGGGAAGLDVKIAVANSQDGNYAAGISVLQQRLCDARVTVPPPPTAG